MLRFSSTFLALTFLARFASASTMTSTFEDLGLAPESYNNDADPSGQFVSGGNSFNNFFDNTSFPGFEYWYGWAISSTTDTTSGDFSNQYSAITGTGAGGSATYAVANTGDPSGNYAGSFVNLAAGMNPDSVEITNTTYLVNAITEGYFPASAFEQGDYLRLEITGWSGANGTGQNLGNVEVYLADFRGATLAMLEDWLKVDLSTLAGAASLQFGLQSTDNDPLYGMNTPAYFAIDNLQVSSAAVAVPEPGNLALVVTGILFTLVAAKRSKASTLS